ncbi:MAG: hypothetical protein WC876_07780 [Candidatus Thermoplasmatota archaeon]
MSSKTYVAERYHQLTGAEISKDARGEFVQSVDPLVDELLLLVNVSWKEGVAAAKANGKPGDPKAHTRDVMNAFARFRSAKTKPGRDLPKKGGQGDDDESEA